MNLLKSLTDNIGDLIGTSKLARLNRKVFNPVLGTGITRAEYDQAGAGWIAVPTLEEARSIKNQTHKSQQDSMGNRQNMANDLLGALTDQGARFSEKRIFQFISNLQVRPDDNPIEGIMHKNLDDRACDRINTRLHLKNF